MLTVMEDMVPMGEAMIQNGMKGEVEMWRGIMIDDGVMTGTENTLMSTETAQT